MKIICFLLCFLHVNASEIVPGATSPDYYWREYTGAIPSDALPGGKDLSGADTYIGQAYIHSHGLFVVQIYPGKQEVEVPCYGVKTAKINIKILCAEDFANFEWISTSNTRFHVDMIDRHPVLGGYDFVGNKGTLHVGRLMYQGILKIGEISSYNLENALFFFPHANIERHSLFYQALVYRVL